jgi:hypothetical protein
LRKQVTGVKQTPFTICGTYYVSRDKMKELLAIVDKILDASVLADGVIQNGTVYNKEHPEGMPCFESGKYVVNSEVAAENLPTTSGFFFGSTDYDEWYMEDMKLTKKILTEALADKQGEYYYLKLVR